ncbi:MAG: hypothetical protein IPH35_11330 [Rhodoferax sp.]|nr:hypothetical protein [Rhodoferax sp.]
MNSTQLWHDPIVEEIHATRERLAEQYHNDLVAYSKAAELHCQVLGFRIVESPRPQPFQESLQKVEVAA